MGLRPILRELDEAKKNRGAAAAIAVYSRADHMPAGTAPFSEHGLNLYLCLHEKESLDAAAPEFAYRAARFWVVQELVHTEARGPIGARPVRSSRRRASCS